MPEPTNNQEVEEIEVHDVIGATQPLGEEEEPPEGEENAVDDEFGGATDAEIEMARANGWAGKAGWKGDPERFKTAKDFALQSAGINAVLKRELTTRDRKHAEEIAQLRKDVEQFQEMTRKTAERELGEQISAIRARRVQALNDGDGVAVDAAERELADLQRTHTPPPKKEAPAAPAISAEDKRVADDFQLRNPWFEKDMVKTRLAMAVAAEIRNDSPHLQGNVEGYLTELESRLKRDYAAMFGEKRMTSSRTEGGDPPRTTQRVTKKTFEMLPKDAQQACDRLIKQGIVKKREDYLKNFDWANP